MSLKDGGGGNPSSEQALSSTLSHPPFVKERGPTVRIDMDLMGSEEWLGRLVRGLEG